ncbi:putative galactoside ABC transporter [Clostridium sp. DL-VIII]|uniref:galactose ABC transporter substrate-binding protein n=1 Tax=Clostridium sp. DL-VIII TaxID=641107 RepID=UPI00023B0612|nr:galactose ABC transporter substrate-binding protein [Clostridium sp. DL-VIII]EHJ00911.1 putative galactoside ABC transporter [Clostridium sp. DL-VIII]
MKTLKKILAMTAIIIMCSIILVNNFNNVFATDTRSPVRIGVFSKDLNDDYLILLRKSFEEIQKRNPEKVIFTFYDAKFNPETQNLNLENTLKEGIDLVLLDMVDVNQVDEFVKKIAKYDIPVIFFNREPLNLDPLKTYKKSLYIGTDSKQAGILQGKMIADAWKNYKKSMDKNNDDILQYVMLVGERFNKASMDRSTFSISTIQESGIKTQELASKILNWSTENAKDTVGALFLKYGNNIEAIISNDDSMAIGAVQALQQYGYNSGDKAKVIAVVGVDGVPEAQDLISKGFMLGTAFQDPDNMANTIYTVGLNLIDGKNPTDGIPYKLDDTGVAIKIPFKEVTGPMFKQ